MAKLSYAEVMERVEWLENDTGLKDLHTRDRDMWQPLFKMTHTSTLPDHMTRGITVDMPSPRLKEMTDGLLADFASYRAVTSCIPFADDGNPSQALKNRADKIERFASLLMATWNENGKFDKEAGHSMLAGAYFVVILHCGDGEKANPWSLEFPDRLSCFFPVNGSPSRPEMMARRYNQLVRKIESEYSGRGRDSLSRGKNLKRRSGKWQWEAIGDDSETQGDRQLSVGGSPEYGEEAEMIWYADKEYVYHIAMNEKNTGGEIVYCEPNMAGGCPALVVSGSTSPLREPKERLGPALLPVIQCVLQINLIRSIRAIKALNAKPDVLIEMTPEAFATAQDTGLVSEVAMTEGQPNLLNVGGKPVPWALTPDPDLESLEESWNNELMEYVGHWAEPNDPKTVADSTANAYVLAVGAVRRRQTPLLKDRDWAKAELLKMALHSITEYDQEFKLSARGAVDLASGQIGAGSSIALGPSDLADIDFDIEVVTRAVTESEQRARDELGMQRVAWGIETLEGVIEASYPDATTQMDKLATDTALRLLRMQMPTQLDTAYRDSVRLRSGVLLPMGGGPAGAVPPDQIGQSGMQPAAIPAPEGGGYE